MLKEKIRLENEPYKLVLTDVNMPGMDGFSNSKCQKKWSR